MRVWLQEEEEQIYYANFKEIEREREREREREKWEIERQKRASLVDKICDNKDC